MYYYYTSGHDVLRLNHIGDWGTQFGMLIHYLKTYHPNALIDNSSNNNSNSNSNSNNNNSNSNVGIGDLVEFYRRAKEQFDSDLVFQEASRAEVVRLQSGNETSLKAWNYICNLSRIEFQDIYDKLQVNLIERGQSL